jgi:hypothetical protein
MKKRAALNLLALLCLSLALIAQTNTGTITGEVYDATKAVVAGARVRVTNLATNITQETATTGAGVFSAPSLQPGTYRVTVEAQGFKTATVEPVEVLTAGTASLTINLEIGQASETVQVVAEAPMLLQDTAALSTTVENKLLTDIPFPERSALGAIMISAGVTGDPQYQGGIQSEAPGIFTQEVAPGGGTQMGGGRPGSGSILVDGSDVSLSSIARTGVTFSGDTVQEVTVQVNGVPAQYGRTGGGIINQSTKGGGSQYHGGLFWQHTDPGLQAWTHGTHEIDRGPQKRQNYYSGFVGGPVKLPKKIFGPLGYDGSQRTFFYASVEPSRLFDQFFTPGRVLTPRDLAGDLNDTFDLIDQGILASQGVEAALAAPRRGRLYYQFPVNAQGFPVGNQYSSVAQYVPIPNNNLSAQLARNPLAQAIFKLFPTPQNPGPYTVFIRPDGLWDRSGNNAYVARGVESVDRRYSFRVDHQISANDRANFRYTYVPVVGTRFNFLGPDSPANGIIQDNVKSKNFAFSETHVFGGGKVNEFRATLTRVNQFRGPSDVALSQDYAAQLGLRPATNGRGFPAIGGLPQGVGTGGGTGVTFDSNLGLADDFSWIRGRHSLKFGVDFRFFQFNRIDNTGLLGGNYSFSGFTNGPATPGTTGATLGGSNIASFILGIVNNFTVRQIEVPFYYRWKYYAGYFQDDFKVRQNLTLNLGVRYDVETPRTEKQNRQGYFDPTVTGTLNGKPVTGGFVFSGEDGRRRGLWATNFKGWQPRLGFAWTPYSKMTVRGSYAILRTPLTGVTNAIIPDLSVPNQSIGGLNGGVGPGIVNIITNPPGPIAPIAPLSDGPLFQGAFSVPYIDQSDAVPYIQQWSFALQFQLTNNFMFETSYSGNRGTHLFGSQIDINQPSYALLQQKVREKVNFSQNIPNLFGLVDAAGRVRQMNVYQSLRPYPQFFDQAIPTVFDRSGNSIYHGLYVSFNQRFSKTLYLQGSYTWQKSIDDVSSSTSANTGIFGSARPQRFDDLRAERSESTYNIPHKLTVGYSYELPLGKGRWLSVNNRVLDTLFGGWRTAGLFTRQAGFPVWVRLGSVGYWISQGGGDALAGTTTLRPNIVPGVPLTNNDWKADPYGNNTNFRYINPAAFSVPGSLDNPQFGNAARTLPHVRNPWTTFFDANLAKQFDLPGERLKLELRGDFINALNHPNFFINANTGHDFVGAFNRTSLTNPNASPFTVQTAFGKFDRNNTTPARLIRVGVRLTF